MSPYLHRWLTKMFANMIRDKGIELLPLQQRRHLNNNISWTLHLSQFGDVNTLSNPEICLGEISLRLWGSSKFMHEGEVQLRKVAYALVNDVHGLDVDGALLGASFTIQELEMNKSPQNSSLNMLGELQLATRLTLHVERGAA